MKIRAISLVSRVRPIFPTLKMKFQLFTSLVAAVLASDFSKTVVGDTELSFLNGNYVVSWEFIPNKDMIQFNVTVTTTGWVGLGFSMEPNMVGADIVVGWISDDNIAKYSSDYHLPGNSCSLIKDITDNWTLLTAASYQSKNNDTVLIYRRFLKTADENGQDVELTGSDMYIIWAFGDTDEIDWQNGERGSKLINLFYDPDTTTTTTPNSPETTTSEEGQTSTTEDQETTTTTPGDCKETITPGEGQETTSSEECQETTTPNDSEETTTAKGDVDVTTAGVTKTASFSTVLILLVVSSIKFLF